MYLLLRDYIITVIRLADTQVVYSSENSYLLTTILKLLRLSMYFVVRRYLDGIVDTTFRKPDMTRCMYSMFRQ